MNFSTYVLIRNVMYFIALEERHGLFCYREYSSLTTYVVARNGIRFLWSSLTSLTNTGLYHRYALQRCGTGRINVLSTSFDNFCDAQGVSKHTLRSERVLSTEQMERGTYSFVIWALRVFNARLFLYLHEWLHFRRGVSRFIFSFVRSTLFSFDKDHLSRVCIEIVLKHSWWGPLRVDRLFSASVLNFSQIQRH